MVRSRSAALRAVRVLACAILATGAVIAASAANNPQISGTVQDAASSAPLNGMVVAAYNSAGVVQGSATTDGTGRYVLRLAAGQYRLLVYDPSGRYATAFYGGAESFDVTSVVQTSEPNTVIADFRMPLGGTIAGAVSADGLAVSGIVVAAYNLPSGTRRGFAVTDGSGSYALVLPPGNYRLAAYENRTADQRTWAIDFSGDAMVFDDAAVVTVVRQKTVSAAFHLQRAAVITGSVIAADSKAPLPNATVYAYTPSGALIATAPAAADGSYFLSLPPAGVRLIGTDPSGIYAATYGGDADSFTHSPTLSLASGTATTFSFVLPRAGHILGAVLGPAGLPLQGIHVAAYNSDGSSRAESVTDILGAYSLPLPAGTYRLAAYDTRALYAVQFYPLRATFEEAGGVTVATGATTRGADFALPRAGRFAGTVTDGSGQPVAGISIAAYDLNGRTAASSQADASGGYALAVAPGTYRLLTYDGAHTYANAFAGGATNYESTPWRTIATDEMQVIDFTVRPGVTLSGTVVAAAGLPIGGIRVDADDGQESHVASATTDAFGRFQLTVVPGTYRLHAEDPTAAYAPAFYGGSRFEDAALIVVGAAAPPVVTFEMTRTGPRHRSVRH